ncbi:FxsA family protein [Marinivivus vitaminiproducens]|uniref:FxsA family protein n=1 Tax=Marinivivus vitaminiproducens TaxID=3035935 RepID=UPI00279C7A4E|nr:FxsA family protein [Geminicoccaceae bacterium SCSIO 64248]
MTTQQKQTPTSWVRPGPLLLVAFLAYPLAEIATFILVGSEIGVLATLGLILLSAVLGIAIIRRQGFATLTRARQNMDRGVAPVAEAFEGLCLALAGVLLVLPGFLTDVAGALLLVPPLRRFLYARMPGGRPGTRTPPRADPSVHGPGQGKVIDVDYVEVTDETPPPPPGRGWGPKR